MSHIRTQQDLADLLGCSLRTVKRWEMGKSFPRQDSLSKMKKLFNLSSIELLYKESKAIDNLKFLTGIWQGYSIEHMGKHGLKGLDFKRSIVNYPMLTAFYSDNPQKIKGISALFHFDHPRRRLYYPLLKLQGHFLTDESFELQYRNENNSLHRGTFIFTFSNENTLTGSFCGLGSETERHTNGEIRLKRVENLMDGNPRNKEKFKKSLTRLLLSQKSYKNRHGKTVEKADLFFKEYFEFFNHYLDIFRKD